jgi:hypothetical protein
MPELCDKQKVSQELMVTYNLKQNGMAERLNRALCEMVRCMLKDSNMENKYWAEALKTATYVRNLIKIRGKNNGMSPYQTTMARHLNHRRANEKKLICFLRMFLDAIALPMYQRRNEANWMTHQSNASFWGTLEIKKPATMNI